MAIAGKPLNASLGVIQEAARSRRIMLWVLMAPLGVETGDMVTPLNVRVAEPQYSSQSATELRPCGLPRKGFGEEGLGDSSLEFAPLGGCPGNLEQQALLQGSEPGLQLCV